MPSFLTREQVYDVLNRELPEGVYAQSGSPDKFYTTASIDSKAKVIESAYSSLSRIYDNYFPQTADEKIDDWMFKMFGTSQSNLSLADKRARIIEKVRKQPKINLWEVLTLISGYVPAGTYVQIVEWCDPANAGPWTLDVSKLGYSTILGVDNYKTWRDFVSDPTTWCEYVTGLNWRLGVSELGISTALAIDTIYKDVTNVQLQAYNYEIRVFDYTIPDLQLSELTDQVKAIEPARSTHIIKQNLSLAAFSFGSPISSVDEFSGVSCITRDTLSTTGYKGLI